MKKHFRLLIHHIIDGLVIVGTDGLIRLANPAAEQLFHRTSEELTGTAFGFPVTENRTTEKEIVSDHGRLTTVEMRVVAI
jgi:PAS domain S-box-containing protein